ncbi:MAG TPA: hypothetical protein PLQ41_00195 [bacterium]|nr:hypothetical protein [bacterium]HPP30570.1 hypothetical protein [bacterium]
MKGILFFILFICILLSGCCVPTAEKTMKPQKEETGKTEASITEEGLKDPYGKYTLETADVEVWFYDDHFVYFDRDRKVVKNYETIDTDSH